MTKRIKFVHIALVNKAQSMKITGGLVDSIENWALGFSFCCHGKFPVVSRPQRLR